MTGGPGEKRTVVAPANIGDIAPLSIDPDLCIGCDLCVDVCQVDILLPNAEAGSPPAVAYPEECWYDGSCVVACPVPGAITLNRMEKDRVHYRRRESGEGFYI